MAESASSNTQQAIPSNSQQAPTSAQIPQTSSQPTAAPQTDTEETAKINHTLASGGTPAFVEDRSQGQILSDFLHQLEDYTPTIPDAVTAYFCQTAGFEASDPRIVRLISIAAQKFISDVANDALQHCKTRTSNAPTSHGSSRNPKAQNNKDRKYTLTMEDLAPALSDYGITVRKAHYFV